MTPDHLLITGDFNIHAEKPEEPTTTKFLSLLQSFGLIQHVTAPTHVAGHTLDLVITCEDCDLLASAPVAHYMMSTHSTVLFPLNTAKPKCPIIVRSCQKIKSIYMNQFRSDIKSSLLLLSPTQTLIGKYNKIFKVCMLHLRNISKIHRILTTEACNITSELL